MVSKVFLFGEHGWLYCSDVRLKDGVYSGWVENGAWHLVYDTKTKLLESYQSAGEKRLGYKPVTSWTGELTWMCYPHGFGYNNVIMDVLSTRFWLQQCDYGCAIHTVLVTTM